MEEIQEEANLRRQEIRKQGRIRDNTSSIGKDEYSISELTEPNEWTDIVLERVLENHGHHMRFNSSFERHCENMKY